MNFADKRLGTHIQQGADISGDSRDNATLGKQAWRSLAKGFCGKK